MALDEYLFERFTSFIKNKKQQKIDEAAKTVKLINIKDNLTIIARAITGNAIDIFDAENEGGYKNNSFFLPSTMFLFSTKELNRQFYIYRTLYLAIQQQLGINLTNNLNKQNPYQLAEEHAHTILQELFKNYPDTSIWHNTFTTELALLAAQQKQNYNSWLYGKLMANTAQNNTNNKLEQLSDLVKTGKAENLTTLKVRAVEEITSIQVDKKAQEDYVLTHNFEKVDTAEEFDGIWRDFDGDDELENHAAALDELSMKYTVRIDDMAHSVYQADFIENTTISESAEVDKKGYHINYPEWDFKNTSYKENFCKLYPITLLKKDASYYKNTIKNYATILTSLRKMVTSLNNKRAQQLRQNTGNEFDLDATTDLYVDLHAKQTPNENIYINSKKTEKDISILLLLDISLSSDGYSNGNRILDVEKEVAILFGEILHENQIDFAINSFYSKTRNFSMYQTLKDFDEKWDTKKHVIGGVEPNGYTRIGTALRHSGALLNTRKTKNKWIIVLSDGKPNDYDKYEGKYGLNDVKKALSELKANQINTYALAIEAQAKYYLPQMFGSNHYKILSSTHQLLDAMVILLDKIKHN